MKQSLEGSAQEQYVKMLAKTLDGIQRMRIETGNRIAGFEKLHGAQYGDVVDSLKSRIWTPADTMEQNVAKDLGKAVSQLPIMAWLEQVTGIGPRLSGAVAGVLAPIARFPTVSALWSYTGYGVVTVCVECVRLYLEGKDKRRFLDRQSIRRWEVHQTSAQYLALVDRVGDDPDTLDAFIRTEGAKFRADKYKESESKLCSCSSPDLKGSAPDRKYYTGLILPYNTFLKSTCWRVVGQFVRQGDFYRDWYERYKEKYMLSGSDLSLGQNDNRARRATIKLFLSHLWEMWRKAEGLPVGQTYLQERLGVEYAERHTFISPPYADTFEKKEPISALDIQKLCEATKSLRHKMEMRSHRKI